MGRVNGKVGMLVAELAFAAVGLVALWVIRDRLPPKWRRIWDEQARKPGMGWRRMEWVAFGIFGLLAPLGLFAGIHAPLWVYFAFWFGPGLLAIAGLLFWWVRWSSKTHPVEWEAWGRDEMPYAQVPVSIKRGMWLALVGGAIPVAASGIVIGHVWGTAPSP